MGRKRRASPLTVAMNGFYVGRLERVSNAALRFQYSAEWLARESPTPISLSMPLSEAPYLGDTVWNFFDNLLPDNDDLRRRVQTSLGAASTRPFDLLASAGKDCVGALQISESAELPDVRRVQATPVSDSEIAETLEAYRSRPLGMTPEEDDFRISIAGAQEKTAFLWHQGVWNRPHGATPTTHIFKLPIGPTLDRVDLSDSVENEWLSTRIAAAFGLPVPKVEICKFDGIRVLVVERFDRRWSEDGSWLMRLPTEDTCQSLGVSPQVKYECDGGPGVATILELLRQSQEPAEDQRTFFKALVVYWLLAAIDGHAKNFSLFLLDSGRCKMTPLYDIISAHPIVARKQLHVRELKMAMAVEGKNRHYAWEQIRGRHWLSTAQKARFPESVASQVLHECSSRVPEVVEEVAAALPDGFPQDLSDAVFEGLEKAQKKI